MKRFLIGFMTFGTLLGCSAQREETGGKRLEGSAWESSYVESNGIRIHYWRTGGSGKPVWIMAHGITDFGLNWTPLAREFQDEYDIVMYDARGHGFSEKPSGPYDLETHVADLVGLIQALRIEDPILMGHSMGGSTVALLAARHPDLPRAIILEDPADMLEEGDGVTEAILPDWKQMVREDAATSKAELIASARTERHPGWTDADYELWAESKLLVHPNVVDILHGRGFGDATRTYPEIAAPTLILKADADEERRKRDRRVGELLPRGILVHVEGAGHVIRNDQPEMVIEEIRRFLAGLSPEPSAGGPASTP